MRSLLFCTFIAFVSYGGIFCGSLSTDSLIPNPSCSSVEFLCGTGECVEAVRQCDGHPDCKDESDETPSKCSRFFCDLETSFVCAGNPYECLGKGVRCDEAFDCYDESDEKDCHKNCLEDEFRCNSGTCFPLSYRCNGRIDCKLKNDDCSGENCAIQGEDEFNCTMTCPENRYMCQGAGNCIPMKFMCDGSPDCLNGDDEDKQHCGSGPCRLQDGHFKCATGDQCFQRNRTCDGKRDCLDGSDEDGKCDVKCDQVSCRGCFNTPFGPACMCHAGHKLGPGNITCEDINECTGKVSACDHFCSNTKGSFTCSCQEGYELLKDKKSCGIDGQALLLYSLGTRIKAEYLDEAKGKRFTQGRKTWSVWVGDQKTSGLAYDPIKKKVYFIAGNKYVYSTLLEGDHKEELVIDQGLENAENLAIDWYARNLYITVKKFAGTVEDADKGNLNGGILVCSLETGVCAPIFIKDLSNPRAIQLDLDNRHLYFTDVVSHSIARTNLDGSGYKTIIKDNLRWINGLVLDLPASRMYFADAHTDEMESSDLDGQNRKVLPKTDVAHPFSIAVWENRLYWTELKQDHDVHKEINSCLKRDGRERKPFYRDKKKIISNIVIYHKSMRQTKSSPCFSDIKSPCSHICIPSSNDRGFICKCPVEMTLSESGLACQRDAEKSVVMFLVKSKLYLLIEPKYGKKEIDEMRYGGLDLKIAADADYDPVTGSIYIGDPVSGKIHIINMKTREVKSLPETLEPTTIAVDWMRDNIYWVDKLNNIEVSRTNGQFRRTIEKTLNRVRSIALAVGEGYLFIAHGLVFPSIKRCNLNGTECNEIIGTDLDSPSSVVVNYKESKIYWSDPKKHRIERSNYDGTGRETVVEGKTLRPWKLFMSLEALYWVDKQSVILHKLPFANSNGYHDIALKIDSPGMGEWSLLLVITNYYENLTASDSIHKFCFENSGCHQLCFASSEEKICGCAHGLKVSADGRTCEPVGCSTNERECRDKSCIPEFFWCDSDVDCDDESDEENCTVTCTEEDFACKNGRQCIVIKDKCDTLNDCVDGSDEEAELCQKGICLNGFKCTSGDCIPSDWRCNKKKDCKDGSDEKDCSQNTCNPNQIRCATGLCVARGWICDGQNDCPQGEDERNCSCTLGQFKCKKDGSCISEKKLCNGVNDCNDQSDESPESCKDEVYRQAHCNDSQRPCSNSTKQCIPHVDWCNGQIDCKDGEDEKDCPLLCGSEEIKCKDGLQCVYKKWICDGSEDCSDSSDEESCNRGASVDSSNAEDSDLCGEEEYECQDGSCIVKDLVCDGTPDCASAEDESIACEKCNQNHGGCQHECIPDDQRISCSCREHFLLAKDGRKCDDIDECEDEYICDQICTNLKGTYSCSCNDGYNLMRDEVTCKLENGKHTILLTKESDTLKYIWHNGSESVERLPVRNASVAHDPIKMGILVLDGQNGTILRKVDGKWKRVLEGIENGDGLAFDYINRNVYISESWSIQHKSVNGKNKKHDYSGVKVCNLVNGMCRKIYDTHRPKINSILVSVRHQIILFCINYPDHARIISLNLDGSSNFLLKDKILHCGSLAIHEARKRIYWIDERQNAIGSVTIHKHGREKLVFDKLHYAKGLTRFEHGLAWINEKAGYLVQCDLTRPRRCTERYVGAAEIVGSIPPIVDLEQLTPCTGDICSNKQICIPHSITVASCLCPDNTTKKGSSCKPIGAANNNRILSDSCAHDPCHGGTCSVTAPGHIECRCPPNREGKFCEVEKKEKQRSSSSSGVIAVAVILFLFAVLLCSFGVLYKQKPEKFSSLKRWKNNGYNRQARRFRFNNAFGLLQEEAADPTAETPPVQRTPVDETGKPIQININVGGSSHAVAESSRGPQTTRCPAQNYPVRNSPFE